MPLVPDGGGGDVREGAFRRRRPDAAAARTHKEVKVRGPAPSRPQMGHALFTRSHFNHQAFCRPAIFRTPNQEQLDDI